MRKCFFLLLLLPLCVHGQVYTFVEDAMERGYHTRPYDRYEAEPSYCQTNGIFLETTDDQRELQSEASHQQALQLINKGDYVSWQVAKAGAGLTIRFSLPDSDDGKGTKGILAVYAGDEHIANLTLDSYWAWQYTAAGGTYPDNTPGEGKMIRMRFDETHILLPKAISAGAELRLVKADDNNVPYTIDFVELEDVPAPVLFEDIADDNKVLFDPVKDKYLNSFIAANAGKTIYVPAGKHEVTVRMNINNDNTKLIGAGIWYTELYFSASSDERSTHNQRGIEANASNIVLEGFFINTINNKRYYNNDSRFQVGKGLMGSWGSNSVIRNCWIEHFECGGWIATYSGGESKNLLIEHCRFRNNYADGINLCQGSTNNTVQHCSFRNNGDDDMASWSVGQECSGNTYAYCTAENNWRASSLGFFGGKNQTGHHIAIYDGLESGVRVNADFNGTGFSAEGQIYLHDISIVHCGCVGGSRGTSGDFWGNQQGAFNIGEGSNYVVQNVLIEDIDIIASRSMGIYMRSGSGKRLHNIALHNIHVQGGKYGIFFGSISGAASYCNLTFSEQSIAEQNVSTFSSFTWTSDCETGIADIPLNNSCIHVYDIMGRPVQEITTAGVYIVRDGNTTHKILKSL